MSPMRTLHRIGYQTEWTLGKLLIRGKGVVVCVIKEYGVIGLYGAPEKCNEDFSSFRDLRNIEERNVPNSVGLKGKKSGVSILDKRNKTEEKIVCTCRRFPIPVSILKEKGKIISWSPAVPPGLSLQDEPDYCLGSELEGVAARLRNRRGYYAGYRFILQLAGENTPCQTQAEFLNCRRSNPGPSKSPAAVEIVSGRDVSGFHWELITYSRPIGLSESPDKFSYNRVSLSVREFGIPVPTDGRGCALEMSARTFHLAAPLSGL
ncbi:hypothetical protein CEXT_767261 [Caerostris extrusa]|uniref:Uncharacterized protein n=1 Tax=Caerostris extrusa TaxID=172846 RepID=A0AAV4P626_CAEEX|nr:hypothetical protein CEXT_767261 [Caerostris extrusa]